MWLHVWEKKLAYSSSSFSKYSLTNENIDAVYWYMLILFSYLRIGEQTELPTPQGHHIGPHHKGGLGDSGLVGTLLGGKWYHLCKKTTIHNSKYSIRISIYNIASFQILLTLTIAQHDGSELSKALNSIFCFSVSVSYGSIGHEPNPTMKWDLLLLKLNKLIHYLRQSLKSVSKKTRQKERLTLACFSEHITTNCLSPLYSVDDVGEIFGFWDTVFCPRINKKKIF